MLTVWVKRFFGAVEADQVFAFTQVFGYAASAE
jgi:hypothetical protein